MSLSITILGCGSSGGVPRVGQGWGACDPSNPKNRRRRCSILVEQTGAGGRQNAGADRYVARSSRTTAGGGRQAPRWSFAYPPARRPYPWDRRPAAACHHARRKIDFYMDEATSAVVRASFSYLFATPAGSQYPPLLNERRTSAGVAVHIEGPGGVIEALPFRLKHGEIDALGFRFGNIAYSPDLNAITRRGA